MRSLAGVFVGVGLLLVTSCSTSQSDISDVQVADASLSSIQSNRAEPSVHSHADGHRGHGEGHHANDQDGEPASNHENAHVRTVLKTTRLVRDRRYAVYGSAAHRAKGV